MISLSDFFSLHFVRTVLPHAGNPALHQRCVLHPVFLFTSTPGPLSLMSACTRPTAPADQSLPIFTGVFVIVWLGSVVVTLNAKLLGGKV